MTIKKKIKVVLKDRGWLDKQTICDLLTKRYGGYSDSVGRELRNLARQGEIEKRKKPNGGKGTDYKYGEARVSSLIEKQNARIEQERLQQQFNSQPTLI